MIWERPEGIRFRLTPLSELLALSSTRHLALTPNHKSIESFIFFLCSPFLCVFLDTNPIWTDKNFPKGKKLERKNKNYEIPKFPEQGQKLLWLKWHNQIIRFFFSLYELTSNIKRVKKSEAYGVGGASLWDIMASIHISMNSIKRAEKKTSSCSFLWKVK